MLYRGRGWGGWGAGTKPCYKAGKKQKQGERERGKRETKNKLKFVGLKDPDMKVF